MHLTANKSINVRVVENSRVCNYDKMLKNVIVGITCEVELCCV